MKAKILILDDDEQIRQLLGQILKENGYAFAAASDAEEARDLLKKQNFELILCDIGLPGESGIDFTRFAISEHPKTAAIMMTGQDDSMSFEESLEIGVYDYITKPFAPNRVLFSMANALKRRKLKIANRAYREDLEKKVAERTAALTKSNEEYRLLIKNIPSVVYRGYRDWSVDFLDNKIELLIGYEVDEFNLRRMKWSDIIVKEDIKSASESFLQALKTDKSYIREYRIKTRGGDILWIQERGQIVCDSKGEIEYVSGVFFDITEHKQAGEALRQSERDLAVRNKVAQIFLTVSDEEIYGEVLHVILQAMESEYGLFGYIDRNGALVCPSMTRDVWDRCQMPDKDIILPRKIWGGLWGRALIEKKTFCSNGPLNVPEGHVPLSRALAVPIIHHDVLIGLIAVANKRTDYALDDQEFLANIANYIAPVLHARLQRDREEQKRKLAEKRLRQYSSELEKRKSELEETLHKLRKTQSQLLQSEKMASIGQLAAGVAHEINNPTGFVGSNLRTLSEYLKDINGLMREYRKFVKDVKEIATEYRGMPVDLKQLEYITAMEEEVDIDFIVNDISDLINESREGTERIKKIVQDLKDFAHPGEDKQKFADINRNLDSTLNVVANEIKYKAVVIKDYGELPEVKCYPQQLNQVFVNVLVNAAQAIEKKGEIKIKTRAKNGNVQVTISDTGKGIPKENLSKIFDPFFTTKKVGSGTGLGMNVAYNIIKKHNGTIDVESTVGAGTTFTIRLPVE